MSKHRAPDLKADSGLQPNLEHSMVLLTTLAEREFAHAERLLDPTTCPLLPNDRVRAYSAWNDLERNGVIAGIRQVFSRTTEPRLRTVDIYSVIFEEGDTQMLQRGDLEKIF